MREGLAAFVLTWCIIYTKRFEGKSLIFNNKSFINMPQQYAANHGT